jgi:hypothetical protein
MPAKATQSGDAAHSSGTCDKSDGRPALCGTAATIKPVRLGSRITPSEPGYTAT